MIVRTVGLTVVMAATLAQAPARDANRIEERRTYYANGRPYQVRHLRHGQEEGLQQAWTEDGVLYVNYEMRHGRRYGLINARPCEPVKEAQ